MLLAELAQWPLPVEEIDEQTGAGASPSSSHRMPPVRRLPSYPAALQLVRWELDREHDAYDEYMRNRRYQEIGIPEGERPVLLLVSRWVLEQLLSLSEATGGRVDRRALLGVVERLERGLARAG